MTKIRAAITAVNGWVPDYVLDNKELEKLVDTNDEWIMSRTGIKERRILKGENKGSSDIAVEAIKGLLDKRGIGPEEIDAIICATTTPDMVFPATANIIADKMGMKNTFGYDVSAACSGFLFSLITGAKFVESGQYKKVLIVGVDKMSAIVDYSDRATCVIFGDGGGADDADGQPFIGGNMIGHGETGNGQDVMNPLGTILRIDPTGSNSANSQYGIPSDNPFVGGDPKLDEIYAYGLRNVFRFSFDKQTGDLYAADVGQNDIEEVNLVTKGGNYGWNVKEGSKFFYPNGNNPGFVSMLLLHHYPQD